MYSMMDKISIHAPLTGCDFFNNVKNTYIVDISIHAPLTGCDWISIANSSYTFDFNPRTPYGMRRVVLFKVIPVADFNPRTPYGIRLN